MLNKRYRPDGGKRYVPAILVLPGDYVYIGDTDLTTYDFLFAFARIHHGSILLGFLDTEATFFSPKDILDMAYV